MKHPLITTTFALLATLAAQAQWTSDVSVNTTVRAVAAGEATTPLTAEGPDGSTYVAWFENEGGEYQLRMQRLDAGGNRLWPDTGLVVSDHPQNSAIFSYDLKNDDDDNAIVAFQDERTGALDIVAYKIAPDGSFLWGPDGVQLPTPGTTGMGPTVAPLSNGNTVIAWGTTGTPRGVAMQLVGPTGNVLLAAPIVITASTNVSIPTPIATDDGGFILQYGISAGGFGLPPWVLTAQRYDAAGNTVWPAPVQVSSKSVPIFFVPHPVEDGEDGYYVAFNSGNPDNAGYTDVFVQHVRGNGSLWSTDGTRADISSTIQKFVGGKGLALVDDDQGMMVAMQVTDGGQNQSGVAVQRLDTAGVRQLGDLAVNVIPISAQALQLWDASATDDGAVILHASGGFGQVHLAATRVALNGSTVWNPAQKDICTVNSNKDDMRLTEEEDGQMVAVWKDERSPDGIYAQPIDGLDIPTVMAALPGRSNLARLEQNPSSAPVLLMAPEYRGNAEVQVFDAQGRLAYTAQLPAASKVTLPVSGLAEGLYTIRITGNESPATVRWVKQ